METVAPKTNVMSPADTPWAINLEKQLKIWHENPLWVEKPPQVKVVAKWHLFQLLSTHDFHSYEFEPEHYILVDSAQVRLHFQVSVPKGSLCNLNVNFEVGLPPDAIYNIVIDPNNKRVFKNIKAS